MNTTKSRDTLSLDAENPMLHSPDDDSESADTSSENLPSRETKSCKLMKKMKLQQTKTESLFFCIDVLIKGVLIKPVVAEQTKGTEIHFALLIATKFDIISKWQRIIAEKRINCIIFEIQTAKI